MGQNPFVDSPVDSILNPVDNMTDNLRVRGKTRMKKFLIWGGIFCSIVALILGSIYWWWFEAPHQLTPNVVYGQRDDTPLLLDVFTPPVPNGAGVVLMVSGGWKSGPGSVRPFLFAPFLRRGFLLDFCL